MARFTELTELETLELFVTAKQVMKMLEEKVKFKAFQMLIQEGVQLNPDQHAHLHIIPMMSNKEGGGNKIKLETVQERDPQHIEMEAQHLKELFDSGAGGHGS